MNLYDLDVEAKQMLTIDFFAEKNNTSEDFVEGLSAPVLSCLDDIRQADPKPLIRTFEAALSQLEDLSLSVSQKEDSLISEAKRLEFKHVNNVLQSGNAVDTVMDEFRDIDSMVSEASTSVTALGDSLQNITWQRDRALQVIFLINCYLAFVHKDPSTLDNLKLGSKEDQSKCALTVRQLLRISRKTSDSIEMHKIAKHEIEKYAERLEQELLDQFDCAYRKADIKGMKTAATILNDFNGGSSVIQAFVNQHDFFIVKEKMLNNSVLENDKFWQQLSDPDFSTTQLDNATTSFLDEVHNVIVTETEIITKVFPQYETVLRVFIQRIFAQSIQQRLELLVSFAMSTSSLALLRIIQLAHLAIGNLVADIKLIISSYVDSPALHAVLDQNFRDLFVPYIDNGRYLENESRNLRQSISNLLSRFYAYHSQGKRGGNINYGSGTAQSSGNRLLERISSSAQRELDGNDRDRSGKLSNLFRAAGIERSNTFAWRDRRTGSPADATDQQQAPVTPTTATFTGSMWDSIDTDSNQGANNGNGLESTSDKDNTSGEMTLSMNDFKRCIRWFADAIQRASELNSSQELPKTVANLFEIFLELIGPGYVEVGLNDAFDDAETKQDSELQYLTVISTVTKISFVLTLTAQSVLEPLTSGSLKVRREVLARSQEYCLHLERAVDTVVRMSIEDVLDRMTTELNRQKKKDFQTSEESLYTPACGDICLLLSRVHLRVDGLITGENLNSYLREIGLGLISRLLNHIRKFQISAAGGLTLTKDIVHYHNVIQGWNIQVLNQAFELLREIANLFVVQPHVLPLLLKEGRLSHIRPHILLPFIMRRTDYYSSNLTTSLFLTG